MGESLRRAWARLPVVPRAMLMGFAVLLVGVFPWSTLAGANLKVGSTFPWAFFVELAYLAILWQYLRGKGWPEATSKTRRQYLRANPVKPRVLAWAIISGTLLACALVGLQVVGWMLLGIPGAAVEEFAALARYPAWTVLPLLVMGSVVAGVVEETAFRGYMQVPIERQHGPIVAIGTVAVVFAIAHFPSPLALPGLLLGGIGWGVLAYLTNSILPGVALHTLVDAATWIWAWSNLQSLERIFTQSVLDQDSDGPLAFAVALTFLLGAVTIFGFRKLARVAQEERTL